jgi:probable HAF family extracellular repeat protein
MVFTFAATPPSISVVHTSTGPIYGGVSSGTDGVIYFSTQFQSPNRARVTALNPNTTVKWVWEAPSTGSTHNMPSPPLIDSPGQKLYIGGDSGIFYCLNTSNGSLAWSYTVPSGTDRRIRASAAFDPDAPNGPTVYFHSNNGYLYALNASNGALRWTAYTANSSPPATTDHPDPFSSSPVIGLNGVIYVGSSDGKVYAFNAGNGALAWPQAISVGAPIEATLAIGANGWLYGCTRFVNGNANSGRAFAINPGKAISNPSQAIEWSVQYSASQPGFLVGPIIDQSGFVYVANYHERIIRIDPETGQDLHFWHVGGTGAKFCQTPALNQDGLILVGTSTDAGGTLFKRAIRAFNTGQLETDSYWDVWTVAGQDVGDFLGGVVIRPTGNVYLADTTGRVYRFTGAPLMAGDWPSLQSGNQRRGKVYSYPYVIAELPNYLSGTGIPHVRSVNEFGWAAGSAHGYYYYPHGSGYGTTAIIWKNLSTWNPTSVSYQYPENLTASAASPSGDVAGYNMYSLVPVVWPDGANNRVTPSTLPTPGYIQGYASDINRSSTIIGYATTNTGTATHVFRWNKSSPTVWWEEILGAPAGNHAQAYAISDERRVAGKARFTLNGPWRAYVTPANPGAISGDLGTLGGLSSEAWDTHDDSGTVGWAHNSAGYRRAFYIQVGATSLQPFNELPRLAGTSSTTYHSDAYGVNRFGQAVGRVQNDSGVYRAFLFTPGASSHLTDLNTLVLDGGATPQSLGWSLTSAVSISGGGIIVGLGSRSGATKSWIIYPKVQD